MAEDIIAFQNGRQAAIDHKPRDARRSEDWLEGYDYVMHSMTRDIIRARMEETDG